jgi:hypothetical protein
MMLKESKTGRIYIRLENSGERKWALARTGMEVSDDQKIAFLNADGIGTLQDAANIVRTLSSAIHGLKDAYELGVKAAKMINRRIVALEADERGNER